MKEHVIRFNDEQYTIKVSVDTNNGLKQVVFHRKLENTTIDSKFEMFLDEKQFRDVANFLWFLTSKESS